MKQLISLMFLSVAMCGPVYAKWITEANAPFKNSYTKAINVNKNGTYAFVEEITREILTEEGRRQSSNMVLHYNGDSEKIEILEVRTCYKGKTYAVDKSLIEDKPLASAQDGFDQTR